MLREIINFLLWISILINLKKGIEECIKGKVPAIVFYDGSGNEQHFPADVLRSSVITFEIVKKNVKLKGGAV